MPLPAPAERRHTHTRSVRLEGFEREDGLFDIEGHLVDTKTYSFPNHDRGEIQAGEPLHNMGLRLTIDFGFTVQAVEAYMDDTPFALCPTITPAFQALVGLTIGPGWNKKVRQKLGGIQGCTHLVELLAAMATAAFQTLYPVMVRRKAEAAGHTESGKATAFDQPSLMNGCHVMDESGPLAKERWPAHYVDPKTKKTAS